MIGAMYVKGGTQMEKLLHEMHTWMNAYMRSFRTNDPEVMRGIQL